MANGQNHCQRGRDDERLAARSGTGVAEITLGQGCSTPSNRVVRTRMLRGVGGGRSDPPAYPIRSFPISGSETAPRSNLKEHLGATESDIKFQEEVGLTEDHWDAIALAPGKGKSDRRESLDLHKKDQTARF